MFVCLFVFFFRIKVEKYVHLFLYRQLKSHMSIYLELNN